MLTDVQTPFLGSPFVPLKKGVLDLDGRRRELQACPDKPASGQKKLRLKCHCKC